MQAAEDAYLHEAIFAALVDLGAHSELLQLKCTGLEGFLRRRAGLPASSSENPAGVEAMDAQAVSSPELSLEETQSSRALHRAGALRS